MRHTIDRPTGSAFRCSLPMATGRVSLALIALACASTAGCRQIPQGAFKSYLESFEVARSASEAVLLDHARIVKDQLRRAEAENPNEESIDTIPSAFEYKVEVSKGRAQSAVEERIAAWEMISRFNDAIVALAEGRTVEELSGNVSALGNSLEKLASGVGAAVPGLGGAFEIANSIFKAAEEARSAEEFSKAVTAAQPIVEKILAFLQEETDNYYKVRRSQVVTDRSFQRAKVRAASQEMFRIALEFKEPDSNSDLGEAKSVLRTRLMAILGSVGLKDISTTISGTPVAWRSLRAGDANRPDYSYLANTQLKLLIEKADREVAAYLKLEEDITQYHATLADYVRLLERLKESIVILQKEGNRSASLSSIADSIFKTAITVKEQIAELQTGRQ